MTHNGGAFVLLGNQNYRSLLGRSFLK